MATHFQHFCRYQKGTMFYRIRTSRMSWREYRENNSIFTAGLAYFLKILRVDLPASGDDPNVDDLTPFESAPENLPADVQSLMAPIRQLLESMGFQFVVAHHIVDPVHSQTICQVNFRHPEYPVLARIHYRRWDAAQKPKTYLFPVFISGFADEQYVVSCGGKFDCPSPEGVHATYYNNTPDVQSLWQKHQAALLTHGGTLQFLDSDTAAREFINGYFLRVRDFHLQRGILVPLTEAETNAFESVESAGEGTDPVNKAVHAQIYQKMQNKSSWGSGLLVLGISIMLFIGAGSVRWDWKFVLMLIPILLIHELGHFLAMRVFGYRNVRMFFIPLFGAAVTGQRFNVPAWKTVVVSLMGPVPGILLGTLLGVAGLITHHTWMIQGGLLCIIVNGFNLLPILPLDGGWVVHTLFFSRNPYLDVAFRALAALGLIGLSIATHDNFLRYLGIFMLVGLHFAYKTAKVTHTLRKEPLPPPLEQSDTIPVSTADMIITALRKALPKGTNTKVLAQQTLEVYENLNNRPPHWGATIGFLLIHGGSVVMALLMAMLLIIGKQGDFGKFFQAAAFQPQQDYRSGSSVHAGTMESTNRITIVAEFAKPETARKAFDNFKPQFTDPDHRLTCFGPVLLISQSAADESGRHLWLDRLQGLATNVFVESTNLNASVRMLCIMPNTNVAVAVQQELQEFFRMPQAMQLIPPWQPDDTRTDLARAGHRRARDTFKALNSSGMNFMTNSEWLAFSKKMQTARKQGDSAEVKRLSLQQRELARRLEVTAREQMIATNKTLNADVVAAFKALPENHYTNSNYRTALFEMGPMLGQLPTADGKLLPNARRYSSRSGYVTRAGLLLNLEFINFDYTDEGLPALAEWLCSKGSTRIKFSIISSAYGGDLYDEEE